MAVFCLFLLLDPDLFKTQIDLNFSTTCIKVIGGRNAYKRTQALSSGIC